MQIHEREPTARKSDTVMNTDHFFRRAATGIVSAALLAAPSLEAADSRGAPAIAVAPAAMPAVGRVDERFLSYNVESVEVTGGNFWAPYPKPGETPATSVPGPHGVEFSTGSYQKRAPIDLAGNRRLRVLTKALGPSYMRVSGSWANSIFFQDDDEPAKPAPPGYQGVLTRAQWAGVIDFAKVVDAKILTSFATSEGARDANGAWKPDQARRLFAYTRKLGGKIDAVELMNEPNVSRMPYAPDAFARDQAVLRSLVQDVSPDTKLVGPGSTGEAGFKLFATPPEQMSTARLLSGNPRPVFDVFSHHFYGAVSQRCKSLGERSGTNVNTSVGEAMSEVWLSRADQAQKFYAGLRDRFAPGAPIWITETAQTACGGDPWSATYLDTFRFVDQLGRLARNDAEIVFHNTLAASDYSLIDDTTWLPRPNYWAALLWRRLMGETVLEGGPGQPSLHVYAHCLRDQPGGVAVVAINLDQASPAELRLTSPADLYALTADKLESTTVKLNGQPLALAGADRLPALRGKPVRPGRLSVAPASVSFLAMPAAGNPSCR